MPLLDHFHPPLAPARRWESLHARWASAISDALNANLLPKDYFAEIQAHVGSRVEIDVATMHDERGEAEQSEAVAAVELVSPENKDGPETRRAFAAKCATYLQQGIGLISDAELYAIAYRPVRVPNAERIDVWPAPLTVGKPLPLLPLALDKGICIPLDLEPPYVEACQRSRLP